MKVFDRKVLEAWNPEFMSKSGLGKALAARNIYTQVDNDPYFVLPFRHTLRKSLRGQQGTGLPRFLQRSTVGATCNLSTAVAWLKTTFFSCFEVYRLIQAEVPSFFQSLVCLSLSQASDFACTTIFFNSRRKTQLLPETDESLLEQLRL